MTITQVNILQHLHGSLVRNTLIDPAVILLLILECQAEIDWIHMKESVKHRASHILQGFKKRVKNQVCHMCHLQHLLLTT